MVKFTARGNWRKTDNFFKRAQKTDFDSVLEKYAQKGVEALADATPKDTGLTAASWSYTITKGTNVITISWTNSNFNEGVPIALILQYGHGTGNGGYVTGIDYINPAMKPIFDELEQYIIREVNAK